MHAGRWERGGRRVSVPRDNATTPMYLRDGALVPMQPGVATDGSMQLSSIEMVVALSASHRGVSRMEYVADDGLSFGYRRGKRTRLAITARRRGGALELNVRTLAAGFGAVQIAPVTLERQLSVVMVADGTRRELRPTRMTLALAGRPVRAWKWRQQVAERVVRRRVSTGST